MTRPPLPPHWELMVLGCRVGRAIGKVEDKPNRGQLPDYEATHSNGLLGEFYCMASVSSDFADAVGHASPIILSGSCMQQRIRAKKLGALRTRAEFEAARATDPLAVLSWIVLVIDTAAKPDGPDLQGHAHHAGTVGDVDELTGFPIVTGPRGGFLTIEANASNPKAPPSSNGDGIYRGRERGHAGDHTTYDFIDPAAFGP